MAAANGDRDRVLKKSRDLKFLTGFETKVGNTAGLVGLLIFTGGLRGLEGSGDCLATERPWGNGPHLSTLEGGSGGLLVGTGGGEVEAVSSRERVICPLEALKGNKGTFWGGLGALKKVEVAYYSSGSRGLVFILESMRETRVPLG